MRAPPNGTMGSGRVAARGHAGGLGPGAPSGSEFKVNEHTTGTQGGPAVAADADGNFVVAWSDEPVRDLGAPVRCRRPPAARQFRVNTYSTGEQRSAVVASDPEGNLAVVWSSLQDGSGSASSPGVSIVRQPGRGPGVPRQRVHHGDSGSARGVAFTGDGGFVVVWMSPHDGSYTASLRAGYNASGLPTTPADIPVNSFTPGDQSGPPWPQTRRGTSSWSGPDRAAVTARRVRPPIRRGRRAVGGQFQVNTYVTGNQEYPVVATAPDGTFMVVWSSQGQDGSYGGVAGRRYDAAGCRSGPTSS